ncbi:Sec-independent protein translocase protein TatB [Mumia sp. zg.B53]|uniref:sec-independent translocase n=1 Tax=unclassified Mumia TaxID=2621872 RepID=UPI001C6F30EE|nr:MULTISPECIES: sec-independent translocase [unclassified Mumia]MBW9206781.1 Sec-independent protein translocase protein TatB [Mumia sp. zg.B17]MBW9210931.1 Sec-independent protein translocase protein TatB [Mumia sp. zg.B21]MBW9215497.1 Sec-independent protein translocase protein TatB [Mumia sp. zg.B53]MDD9347297.1 sec-independent translocase [Mumia sp.]
MFDVGVAEMAVIVIVAVLVFGPERLPEFARQLGRLVRTVRQMADNAKADLQREMGDDFTSLRDDIRGLDPREMMKGTLDDDDPTSNPSSRATSRPLEPGEPAPFDVDAT